MAIDASGERIATPEDVLRFRSRFPIFEHWACSRSCSCAPDSGAFSNRMELAGLEPATSWVR
jgi:hypothetical protein